ncbi:uncharacterized protein PGTG_16235 [Puccinia graminis f. sp. tritici CRL 75-36-700-3]|uniref:O-acyltransferase n=1 Tax=Puccinia graminis f. sp. tritici (strain CRL 75-36-700-3 / race SCCL) TaxID=418459 RepID=E3L060_PUCGT|nr:uncharacterized protein PGTG_16235 [Puccinia graminis f. sp. tritici CRL 75-36-700-3]EFP89947.2 hypothetical protein PGTG_16235 [Puccinia graminis f. sp. tritici CRL 75-36-700-3]
MTSLIQPEPQATNTKENQTTVKTTTNQITTVETKTTVAILKTNPKQQQQQQQLLVNFTPRLSTLDPHNQLLHQNPLRGLYALFWILLGFHIIATLHASGSLVIQSPLARLFSKHLPQLALVDLCLVASTFSALGFAKLLSNRYFDYCHTGLILQHLFQFSWLGAWILYIFYREWPWIQSGFLTLHSITMLMKIHSYCATNGEYSVQLKSLESKMKELKRSKVIEIKEDDQQHHKTLVSTVVKTGIYQKLQQFVDQKKEQPTTIDQSLGSNSQSDQGPEKPMNDEMMEQQVHETIDLLDQLGARNLRDSHDDDDQKEDQYSGQPWPENLTISNFTDYLLIPTLVYRLRYPRTKEIRIFFVVEKVFAVVGIFGLIYMITQYYIWDQVTNIKAFDRDHRSSALHLVDNVIRLVVPFTINYLLIFYIIFECICNAFAELTRFADREFYSDWWNSCSFDEFSRKWNKPVHHFLLKHVYASTISSYGVSRSAAAIMTLFLSSLVHELLMVIVTRKLRLYLFLAQMTQLPLTYIGRSKLFKTRPALANAFFWVGLISGFPLLAVWLVSP